MLLAPGGTVSRSCGDKGKEEEGAPHSAASLAVQKYDYTNCVSVLRAELLHRLYKYAHRTTCTAVTCRRFVKNVALVIISLTDWLAG
jgi:hypothetical protein